MKNLLSHSKKTIRARSQRGMTLVEIMVSAVIFAIVVVAAVEFFYLGRGFIREMGLRRTALALSQEKIEELRGLDFSDANLDVGDHGPEAVQLSDGLGGSRAWSVAWRDDPANGYTGSEQDCKQVRASVAWSWEHVIQDTITLTAQFYP